MQKLALLEDYQTRILGLIYYLVDAIEIIEYSLNSAFIFLKLFLNSSIFRICARFSYKQFFFLTQCYHKK